MAFAHLNLPARWTPALLVLLVTFTPLRAEDKPSFDKTPESLEELKAIQKQVRAVLDKIVPATVGVRVGPGQGSGVIVSKDGYVLTAGHVSGKPGRDVTILLPDGKTLKGKTLGYNRGIDSGMIKITDKGDYPFVEMAKSADLKRGQWCLAIGHPGGYQKGRTPVVRLGRVLSATNNSVVTDCTLVGGDSGGPLFDLDGRVIGIHSRIGNSIESNVHVPVDTYRDTWDKLVASEEIEPQDLPYVGVEGDPEAGDSCRIQRVLPGSPAAKAGLKDDDVITKFDGKDLKRYGDLGDLLKKKKPGDKVKLEVRRGDETLNLDLTLGKR
ncbi:MAG: S1C family serine protease [Gemmataceae bacterium]